MIPTILQFADKHVSYETFVSDLAARMVSMMKEQSNDPEYMSQRQAYRTFGRANVQRWLAQGKVTPHKRPGKVEYKTSELRKLQQLQQDYL